jgi:NAD(P)H-dependent FMN reductase
MKPHIQIILGTTREGRRGEKIAKAVMSSLRDVNLASFELIDLKEWDLPLYNFAAYPSSEKGKYLSSLQEKWAKKIEKADGYIVLTPEYNHGPPASLKNAFDYLWYEWNHKPIGFISYGGAVGGSRAVEQLRQMVIEFEMIPIRDQVIITNISKKIDDEGNILDEDLDKRIKKFTKRLILWSENLGDVRKALAY